MKKPVRHIAPLGPGMMKTSSWGSYVLIVGNGLGTVTVWDAVLILMKIWTRYSYGGLLQWNVNASRDSLTNGLQKVVKGRSQTHKDTGSLETRFLCR